MMLRVQVEGINALLCDMKILRYLSRDVLLHMFAVSFILLVIIISGRFVKYLAEAAVGDLAASILLPVMLYRMPGFLELILPLGLFIGILMSYGRLYVESEMVILSACGVSPTKMAGYTLVPAGFAMVLVALLSFYVTPLGAARSEALLDDPNSSQGLQSLAQGRFKNQRGSDAVSYAEKISADGAVMSKVFVAQLDEDEQGRPSLSVVLAKEGEVIFDAPSGARYLELRQGRQYSGKPGELQYEVSEFQRFGQLIPEPEGGIRDADPVDGRSTQTLLASDAEEDKAALYWRVSVPLMVPIVAVLALCMSRTDHRRGRYIKMAPAFVLYLAYLLLLAKARSMTEEGSGGATAFVLVHLGFLITALCMLYGSRFKQWRNHRRYLSAQS
jgi:lipopolysaccharide export system permease protein